MHARREKAFAPKSQEPSKTIREVSTGKGGMSKGCVHCHQVRERLIAEQKRTSYWSPDMIWR